MAVLGWQMQGPMKKTARVDESRVFGLALLAGALLEAGLVAAVAFWPHSEPHTVRPSSIAVQMVTLPTPIPKPVPKPKPRPVVKAHIVPKVEPKPLLVKVPAHTVVPAPPPKPHVVHKVVPPVKPHKPRPAPPPSPSPQVMASLMSRYVGLVRPMIQDHLRVPAMLRAMGLSGHAVIEFRLSPAGRLLWARVLVPSRIHAVDSAALAAVKGSQYPRFLKHMPKRDTTFEITVHISGNGS